MGSEEGVVVKSKIDTTNIGRNIAFAVLWATGWLLVALPLALYGNEALVVYGFCGAYFVVSAILMKTLVRRW